MVAHLRDIIQYIDQATNSADRLKYFLFLFKTSFNYHKLICISCDLLHYGPISLPF